MPANELPLRPDEPDDRPDDGLAVTGHLPRSRLALLFAVSMVAASGNTAMQSVMPSIGTELHVPDMAISSVFALSALLWAVCAPYWARRSDHHGRKAMMKLGLSGFIVSFALSGVLLGLGLHGVIPAALSLVLFGAARLIYGGISSATPSAVQAYVVARTAREERTQAIALIASSQGLGTVVGPGLAPLLVFAPLGLLGPFAAFTLFGIFMLIALHLRLPHDRPAFAGHGEATSAPFTPGADLPPDAQDQPALPAAGPGAPRLRWTDPRIFRWIAAGAIGGIAQGAFTAMSGFLVLDRLGLRATPQAGTGPIGLVMMCGAGSMLLAQWGLIPMLRLSSLAAARFGLAICIVGIAIWAVAGDLHGIALGYAVASLGFGLFRPGYMSAASLAVDRAEQGQVAGMLSSLLGAVYVLSPGGVWLYNHDPMLGFGAIAALCLAAMATTLGSRHG